MKTCRTCQESKPNTEVYFAPWSNRKSLQPDCRECVNEKARQYRKEHPEYRLSNTKKYWKERAEELPKLETIIGVKKTCTSCGYEGPVEDFKKSASTKNSMTKTRLRGTCKKCLNIKQKEWRKQNPEKTQQLNKRLYTRRKANPNFKEYLREKTQITEQNPQYREKKKKRQREYARTSHIALWRRLLKNSLKQMGQSKLTSTQKALGFTSEDLFIAIGQKPDKDYALDHKIPLSWFLSSTPIKIACDLRNLHWITNQLNTQKNNWYADQISQDYFEICKPYIKQEYQDRLTNVGEYYEDNKKGYILECWDKNKSCLTT